MPNHITNVIKFVGCSADRVAEIKKVMSTEKSAFDFNVLIPMPESLMMEESSRIGVYKDIYMKYKYADEDFSKMNLTEDEEYFLHLGDNTPEEVVRLGKQYTDNYNKYGCHTWYDWCCDHWGTKWNSYDVEWSDNEVRFLTAWSGVPDLIKRFASMFEDVEFTYEFADEDFGANVGSFLFKRGRCIHSEYFSYGAADAFRIAADLMYGATPEELGWEYDAEEDTYNYKGEEE